MISKYQKYVDEINTTVNGVYPGGDVGKLFNLFGEYIKELRIAQGLSTKDLSTATGLSVGFINQLENGKNNKPKIESIAKIAMVLNIGTEEYQPIYYNNLFNSDSKIRSKATLESAISKTLNEFGINSKHIKEIISYIKTVQVKQEIEECKWIRKDD